MFGHSFLACFSWYVCLPAGRLPFPRPYPHLTAPPSKPPHPPLPTAFQCGVYVLRTKAPTRLSPDRSATLPPHLFICCPRRGVYVLRAKPDSSEMDSLNIKERQQFMDVS